MHIDQDFTCLGSQRWHLLDADALGRPELANDDGPHL
jgi:hypothetical protein